MTQTPKTFIRPLWRLFAAPALCLLFPQHSQAQSPPTDNGVYRIINTKSGLALDVFGAGKSAGVQIDQWPVNGGKNQYWKASAAQGGWIFTSLNSGLVLEVPRAASTAGTLLDQGHARGSSSQRWTLNAANDGSFKIVNVNSRLLMSVRNASKPNGARVDQETDNGKPAQHWTFKRVTGM